MYNVCHQCGEYCVEKIVDPAGPYAICPRCGFRHRFLYLPLMMVAGASGSGSSTISQCLMSAGLPVVILDSDILWSPHYDTPGNDYRDYFETWLRLCKNIGQSGRPLVLFGSGNGVPSNIEPCSERRYFSTVHYLAKVCDDDVLAARLRARPSWRQSGNESFVEAQLSFNRWYKEQGPRLDPPITLIDTTHQSIEATAQAVADWILSRLSDPS